MLLVSALSLTVFAYSIASVQAGGSGYGSESSGYGGGYGGGSGGGYGGGGGGSDVCGEVNSELSVAHPSTPGKTASYGNISACLCLSTLPSFIASNPSCLKASKAAGKSAVTSALKSMLNSCEGSQSCNYPSNSVPVCQSGNPCGFTCQNGFTPSPPSKPTECVCSHPYKVCNGQCGKYKACPSSYSKRELRGTKSNRCPRGLTACGILGRGPRSWECVDTQSDLESCGGCMLSLHPLLPEGDGIDCTGIPGVSDVSCARGQCIVHRCMPGYDVNVTGDACIYSETKDPVLLAAQFGLEHVPLGK